MRYTVKVPPTREQGSYRTTCSSESHYQSYRAEALQDYNSAREHDGLPPISRMPAGTSYTPIVTFDLEKDYGFGCGWELVTSEETRKEAREQRKTYQDNEGGVFRIVRRPA